MLVLTFTYQVKSTALGTATILPGGANFRTKPNLKSRVIKVLPKGREVELLSEIGGTWYRVKNQRHIGFVHWSRLQFKESISRPQSYLPQGSLVAARQEAIVAFALKNWSEVVSLLHPWANSQRIEFNDLFMLAFSFQEIKQLDLAQTTFESAISRHRGNIDSSFVEIHRHLGALYIQTKQYQRAVNTYDRLLERMPVLTWAMLGKGEALLESGESQKAIAEFSRAINCEPSNPEPFVRLGQAFLKLGDAKKAIRCHKAALQKNPRHEEALIGIAEAYIKLGELDTARKIMEKKSANPSFAKLRKMFSDLRQAEDWQQQLEQSKSELESLKEQQILSGIVTLDVTLIVRLQPSLYEIKLPSGKHALLRFNTNNVVVQDEKVKIYATRQQDARIKTRSENFGGVTKLVSYFKQVSDENRLAYENLNFRIEEKAREIEKLTKKMPIFANKG